MRSALAERIRRMDHEEALRLTVAERIARVDALLEEGIALVMNTRGLTRDEALALIERSRKAGRRRSVLNNG